MQSLQTRSEVAVGIWVSSWPGVHTVKFMQPAPASYWSVEQEVSRADREYAQSRSEVIVGADTSTPEEQIVNGWHPNPSWYWSSSQSERLLMAQTRSDVSVGAVISSVVQDVTGIHAV
jgi:hypothetical protein